MEPDIESNSRRTRAQHANHGITHEMHELQGGQQMRVPAWASPKSVTLDAPGMTCPTCPLAIKKALLKQPGVTAVTVRYEKKQLEVVFDDAKTSPAAIMKSTESVGFLYTCQVMRLFSELTHPAFCGPEANGATIRINAEVPSGCFHPAAQFHIL